MNLGQLQAEIGRLLNDPNNNTWSGDVLTTRINLAQTIVEGYTKAVKTIESLTPTVNVSAVSVNASTMDIIRIDLIQSDGSYKPLDGRDRTQLDFLYPNWQSWPSDKPQWFYYDATLQTVNLVPAPTSTYAVSAGIKVWEIRKPADLSSSSDIPFDSNNQMVPYHLAIVHWVVAQCFLDRATPEAFAAAKFHRSDVMSNPGEFEKQLMRIIGQFDVPTAIPEQILWRPQGGRLTKNNQPTKSYPIG